mmetsp:Transcript_5055/g.20195  ORF Transcript_5055/g.20195 Transcript_5055/m.20195 type:complete len:471 (+) Transcript_5055:902-2314(+)
MVVQNRRVQPIEHVLALPLPPHELLQVAQHLHADVPVGREVNRLLEAHGVLTKELQVNLRLRILVECEMLEPEAAAPDGVGLVFPLLPPHTQCIDVDEPHGGCYLTIAAALALQASAIIPPDGFDVSLELGRLGVLVPIAFPLQARHCGQHHVLVRLHDVLPPRHEPRDALVVLHGAPSVAWDRADGRRRVLPKIQRQLLRRDALLDFPGLRVLATPAEQTRQLDGEVSNLLQVPIHQGEAKSRPRRQLVGLHLGLLVVGCGSLDQLLRSGVVAQAGPTDLVEAPDGVAVAQHLPKVAHEVLVERRRPLRVPQLRAVEREIGVPSRHFLRRRVERNVPPIVGDRRVVRHIVRGKRHAGMLQLPPLDALRVIWVLPPLERLHRRVHALLLRQILRLGRRLQLRALSRRLGGRGARARLRFHALLCGLRGASSLRRRLRPGLNVHEVLIGLLVLTIVLGVLHVGRGSASRRR